MKSRTAQELNRMRSVNIGAVSADTLTSGIPVELADYIKVCENGKISARFKFADELRKIVEYIELNNKNPAMVV